MKAQRRPAPLLQTGSASGEGTRRLTFKDLETVSKWPAGAWSATVASPAARSCARTGTSFWDPPVSSSWPVMPLTQDELNREVTAYSAASITAPRLCRALHRSLSP